MSSAFPTCQESALIDRHFAGTISPESESRMRRHLPDCRYCRERYDRLGLLSDLDPSALSTEQRMIGPLALAPVRSASENRWKFLAAVPIAAAAAIFLFLTQARHVDSDGFASRGAAACLEDVRILRVQGADLEPIVSSFRASDELSFAYKNAHKKAYLMVFAVSRAKRVFWYFPAWEDPLTTPSSIAAISAVDGWTSLKDVVRQPLDAGPVELVSIFSDAPLRVDEVERIFSADGRKGLERAFSDRGIVTDACSVQVAP